MPDCVLCGERILPETAERTGGRCMPCLQRRRVRLNDSQESEYLRIHALLTASGWPGDTPHIRTWLDIETELRRAIQRSSKEVHSALAIGTLTVRDCANTEEAALTIGRLRRQTTGRFAAQDIREVCAAQGDFVQFVVGDRKYEIGFNDKCRDRRSSLLATVNQALEATGVVQRFIPLPCEKSAWPIAFVTQDSYYKAIANGVIPSLN